MDFRVCVSRALLNGKLANSRTLLLRGSRRNLPPSSSPILKNASLALSHRIVELQKRATIPALMGIEGAAAAVYFRALNELLPPDFRFEVRSRCPPRDATNALLSLGYNLVGAEVAAALDIVGLDPHFGFLHSMRHGRPALALDLLEEFRAPLVDRLVLRVLNLRMLQKEDFTDSGENGIRLEPVALKCYLREYERAVSSPVTDARNRRSTTFRKLFLEQARRMARTVRSGEEYQPFFSK